MTVSTTHVIKQYNGNGFANSFVVDFQFIDDGDLKVTVITALGGEVVQAIGVDYDVNGGKNGNGQPGTGSVLMTIPPALGEKLRLERVTPVVQDQDFNLGSNFNPEAVEAGLDRSRLLDQEVDARSDRAVTISVSDQIAGVSVDMPTAVALRYIRWNALGTALENSGGFTWRDAWASGALYTTDDFVQNFGSTYIATATHTSGASTEPGVGGSWPTVWDLVASKGDIGAPGLDAGIPWNFDSSTTMANPGTGLLRLNNAALASVTAIAVNYLSAMTGNPTVAAWVQAWDDSTTPTNKGVLLVRDASAPQNFAIYLINAALTDNSTWAQVPVTHVVSAGALSGQISVQWVRTGDRGAAGAGSGDMLAANNLTDVASPSAAFGNIKQNATTAATGVVEKATDAEAIAKSDLNVVLTPSNLAALAASTTFAGFLEFATDAEAAGGTDTTRPISSAQLHESSVDVASAGTTNIGAAASNYVRITGTTGITAFDTVAAGIWRMIKFAAALTMTHSAALKLPSGAPIITAADDCCLARSDGSGNWIVMIYQKANGQPLIAPAAGAPGPAQGRLTNLSNVPVLTSSVGSQGTIFYTPYLGTFVPIYNGATMVMTDIVSERSQTLADTTKSPAAAVGNKNYDMLVWNDAGTIRCTRSPAWASDTSRGSGAGTAELTRVGGFLVNAQAISNGPAANRGTYVGTIRTNGSALNDFVFGSVAAGGGQAAFGIWNMYNRCDVFTMIGDNTNSWTYNNAAWRAANNSAGLRASFILGLAEDAFGAEYHGAFTATAGGPYGGGSVPQIAIGYDTTSAPSGRYTALHQHGEFNKSGDIGWHFVQAIEKSPTATTTFYGDNGAATVIQTGMEWKGKM